MIEAFNLQTYLEELSKDIPEDTSIVFIEKKLNNTNDEETVLYTVENENSIKSVELTLAFSKNFTQNNWKELIQHYLFYIKHKPFDWIFTKNEISLTMKKWILEYLISNGIRGVIFNIDVSIESIIKLIINSSKRINILYLGLFACGDVYNKIINYSTLEKLVYDSCDLSNEMLNLVYKINILKKFKFSISYQPSNNTDEDEVDEEDRFQKID
ncbi:hypothetical protein ABK040_007015 [Willaertia magna]